MICNYQEPSANEFTYYFKNILSGLVTVIVSRNRYDGIKKAIRYFGTTQVKLIRISSMPIQ